MTQYTYYLGILNDLKDLVDIINKKTESVMNETTIKILENYLKEIIKELK